MSHISGLVAGGAHPSPIPHAHVVTTTTHKSLRGPRSGVILSNDEAIAKKMNSAIFPGLQGGPLMHVVAAKAVCFAEAMRPEFNKFCFHFDVSPFLFCETDVHYIRFRTLCLITYTSVLNGSQQPKCL